MLIVKMKAFTFFHIENVVMDVLISAAHDGASVCKLQLARFLQMSIEDFLKLSDVMGHLQGVQSDLTRLLNCRKKYRN